MSLPGAFYEPTGEGAFESTQLTAGPWSPEHQHGGPPAALLARAIDSTSSITGGQTARLSFDILGPVPVGPIELATRVLRPGRRVELLESTLTPAGADRPVMRATAWRMRSEPTQTPHGPPDPPPPPPDSGTRSGFAFWDAPVAYHRALEWSWIEGDIDHPGPAIVWTRQTAELVAGEAPTPLQRLLTMADAASGASAELDWNVWSFVNVDLGIHLERPPRGEWMAMDARTRIGSHGAGLCTSTLFDIDGRVGVSTASLLVSPR